MNKTNLNKLADYLIALPAAYKGFDMGGYCGTKIDGGSYKQPSEVLNSCGSVGCAVGHGPYVSGLEAIAEDSWAGYIMRVFGVDGEGIEYGWLFSGNWTYTDNTALGAALRIRYMLEHGIPDNFDSDLLGDNSDTEWEALYNTIQAGM